jgi:hypothetical protein
MTASTDEPSVIFSKNSGKFAYGFQVQGCPDALDGVRIGIGFEFNQNFIGHIWLPLTLRLRSPGLAGVLDPGFSFFLFQLWAAIAAITGLPAARQHQDDKKANAPGSIFADPICLGHAVPLNSNRPPADMIWLSKPGASHPVSPATIGALRAPVFYRLWR